MRSYPGLRRAAAFAFWPVAGAIGFLALYPETPQPAGHVFWGLAQYANHVLAFLSLTIIGSVAWGPRPRLLVVLVLGAAAVELAQAFVPQHRPALEDFAASLVGIVIGLALMRVWPGRRRRADV